MATMTYLAIAAMLVVGVTVLRLLGRKTQKPLPPPPASPAPPPPSPAAPSVRNLRPVLIRPPSPDVESGSDSDSDSYSYPGTPDFPDPEEDGFDYEAEWRDDSEWRKPWE